MNPCSLVQICPCSRESCSVHLHSRQYIRKKQRQPIHPGREHISPRLPFFMHQQTKALSSFLLYTTRSVTGCVCETVSGPSCVICVCWLRFQQKTTGEWILHSVGKLDGKFPHSSAATQSNWVSVRQRVMLSPSITFYVMFHQRGFPSLPSTTQKIHLEHRMTVCTILEDKLRLV